jgi:hypothetical protein
MSAYVTFTPILVMCIDGKAIIADILVVSGQHLLVCVSVCVCVCVCVVTRLGT